MEYKPVYVKWLNRQLIVHFKVCEGMCETVGFAVDVPEEDTLFVHQTQCASRKMRMRTEIIRKKDIKEIRWLQ